MDPNTPSHPKLSHLSRWLPRRITLVADIVLLGLAVAATSWLLSDYAPWWSAMLGNMSVVVLLLVPVEMMVAWFKQEFAHIEQVSNEARTTAEAARDTAERTERSLEDVRQELMDRQMAEHESELDIYRAITLDPSRATLLRALRHATEVQIITPHGVRVPVWETDLHYRFVVDGPSTELEVRLEEDDTAVLSTHPWIAGIAPEDFYQELVLAVRRAGRDLGVRLNDPTQSVEELADMLVEVTNYRAQELMGYRHRLFRIIERKDGWYFTENHVLPEDNLRYQIGVDRLNELDWEDHLRGKGWNGLHNIDFARSLYGVGPRNSP